MPGRRLALASATMFAGASVGFQALAWFLCSSLWGVTPSGGSAALLAACLFTSGLTFLAIRRRPDWVPPGIAIGLHGHAMTRICGGLMIGGALFGATFVVSLLLGGIEIIATSALPEALAATAIAGFIPLVLRAFWEEMTFRAWPFLVCVRFLGPHGAALASSLPFALIHTANPDWSPAALASLLLAGLFLSYTMLASRSIAVTLAVHVGWNLTQSILTSRQLWSFAASENPLLSGGAYGLEASAGGICVTATAAAIAAWIRHKSSPL